MKRGLYNLLFFVILTSLSYAAEPYNMRIQAEQQKNKQINNSNIAYQIRQEGQRLPDGSFIPDKIYNIERVSSEHYLPNMLHIKTKSYYKLGKGEKLLGSVSLQTALSELKVINLRAPFADKAENGLQSADKDGISRIYEVSYESNVDPYVACQELMKNPDVEYAVPVFKRYPCYTPNDPRLSNQWGLSKISMTLAWSISKGDTNVIIGIVDSGTDWTHEDLADNIYVNRGEDGLDNQGKSKRTNGIDDDGNGKIDDWHGWALVGNVTTNEMWQGIWKENNNPSNLAQTHGSHVAGCASAVTDNSKGVAGPGFKCKLLPVKCSSDKYSNGGILRGYEGIVYAADMGCKVINCSWGGPGSSPVEQQAITYAYSKGAVVVSAAGNDNGFNIDQGGQYPACYENVLCVGATNSNDKVASFSNVGRRVDVYTPGQGILSTLPGNTYANEDGTSMASPITAGVVALVWSLHPTWSVDQVMHQIRSTSDNVLTSDQNLRSYYYGRLNANNALLYNNGGAQNIPGVEVESYTIVGGNALTNGNSTQVNLKITNYLSPASNLVIRLAPLSSYLTIDDNAISLGTLGSGLSTNASLIVQLQTSNPWYNGTADFLVTFEAGSYKDYQIIRLPISISSNNQYSRVNTFNAEDTPQWSAAMATSETNVWAVGRYGLFGNNGGYLKRTNAGASVVTFNGALLYSLYAFSESRVYMGSGSDNGQAAIFSTNDGGVSPWTTKDVSGITGFVNDIHFFDDNNAIFLGDPKNSKWGIGKTSDGGQNWTAISAPPAPLSGETGLVRSVCWVGDNGWYGTTSGRVFRTTNRGTIWLVNSITGAAVIHLLSFRDNLNGIAIYSESSNLYADRIVASTTNGGATWLRNINNLTQKGFWPVHLFYPDNSSMIYVLCSLGEVLGTSDLGTNWYSALSEKEAQMMVGWHINLNENRARLWEVGHSIGFLDFGYMPINARRDLELVSGYTLDFDTLDIASSKISNIKIKNNGNVDVNIFSIEFNYPPGVDLSEFSLFGTAQFYITPDQLKNIKIRFVPSKLGFRNASVYIRSDGSPDEFNIQLTGYGKDTSSTGVDELNNSYNFLIETINPNPASVQAFVGFTLPSDGNVEISVFNYLGIETKKVFEGVASSGENIVPINVEGLTSGVYYLRLKFSERVISKKFVVNR